MAETRRILALDFGKVSGYVSWEATTHERVPIPLSWKWGEIEMEGDDRGSRFRSFMDKIDGLVDVLDPAVILYEEVRFNRNFSYIPFQMGYVQGMCVAWGLPYVGVNVSELKSWARKATEYGRAKPKGQRRMDKIDMIKAAEELLGKHHVHGGGEFEITDNIADAALVSLWGLENAL